MRLYPKNFKRRAKRLVNRTFGLGKMESQRLDRITCIRYTITWRCNFKCTSCDIWKIEHKDFNTPRFKDEVTPEEVDILTRHPLLSDVEEVVISGGEPTLRRDFPELMLAMHKNLKKARFVITINGYDPDRAYEYFKTIHTESKGKLKWDCIGVSLNGSNREVHDPSRGFAGSFEKVLETANRLREFSSNVAFSFTFLRINVDQIDAVREIGTKAGINTHVCWTVMNDRFVADKKDLVFRDNEDLTPVLERYVAADKVQRKIKSGWISRTTKDWFLRYKGELRGAYLYDSILNHRVMPCNAGQTFFHLAPYGDVYPCNFDLRDERILGNIKENDIEEIMSNVGSGLLGEIKRGDCMYPQGELCGDSDINRSIRQSGDYEVLL